MGVMLHRWRVAHTSPAPDRDRSGGYREAVPRVVAHMDLDAFFAAVEVLEDPSLDGSPLVVGGDPDGRGVVSTASYAARRFGIHSAMPAAEARRRCPHAVFVRPDMQKYRRHSAAVWEIVQNEVPVLEQVGIDEGYLDLYRVVWTSGGARRFLARLQQTVRRETGLDASFGCGTGKTVAKIASDADKPRGLVVVPAGQEAAFLAPRPLRALPGIGPVTGERLARAGLATIGDLAALDDAALATALPSSMAAGLRDRARGIDHREVDPSASPAVSIGHERTFASDVADPDELAGVAEDLARLVAERLRRDGRGAGTVTVKLRYPDFTTQSRAASAERATDDDAEVIRLAHQALARALADRPAPVRLLGVSVTRLVPGAQLQLPPVPPP
jgi:DNA polymerase IV